MASIRIFMAVLFGAMRGLYRRHHFQSRAEPDPGLSLATWRPMAWPGQLT